MAIANIRSNVLRRLVLVASLPILLPLQALVNMAVALRDDVASWPATVRGVWKGPVL